MTQQASVLYDAPGPRARQRNVVYTVLFVAAVVAAAWWLLDQLAERNQLDAQNWTPLLEAGVWTDFFLPGLLNTLQAAFLSILIALPVGVLLGIGRLSQHAWIRWPAAVWVEFFRATPVLILMLFARELYRLTGVDTDILPLYAVVTGLVLYNAPVLAEVVRAGIVSLPRGQSEAAEALGLRRSQVMTSVLLPQAITAMLPAIVSQLVVIVKDTALGGVVIRFEDVMAQFRPLPTSDYRPSVLATLTAIAVIFLVLNSILTTFANWLEKWLRQRKKGTGTVVTADLMEEQAPGVRLEDTEAGAAGKDKG